MKKTFVTHTEGLRPSMAGAAAATLLAAACGTTPSAGVPPSAMALDTRGFEIRPGSDVLSGDPIQITLRGFAPDVEINITAERPVTTYWPPPPARLVYRARATFKTSHAGTLDLATARPLSGSYQHADVRGLFWSMTPTRVAPAQDWPDERVRLTASQSGGPPLEAALTLRESDPKIEIIEVGAEFPGALLARLPGSGMRPAIIVLGGSEGGDYTAKQMAPLLASHGYAVLGLPYYAPAWVRADLKTLPAAFVDIPIDRLERARDGCAARPASTASASASGACPKAPSSC